MKDEIKEILDNLKNEDNYIEDYGFRYKRIALDDVWHLLDYITNLQEERNNMACLVNDLQEKIDEAIDYIDDNTYYKDHKGHINIDDVYMILQGKSDE